MEFDKNPLAPPARIRKYRVRSYFVSTALLSLIVVLGGLGLTWGAVYYPTYVQFLPSAYVNYINQLLLNTTLPKTPFQIALGISQTFSTINQFQNQSFLELGLDPRNILALRTNGSINSINSQSPSLEQKITAYSITDPYGENSFLADVKIQGQSFYFKLNYLPTQLLSELNSPNVLNQWYEIPLARLSPNLLNTVMSNLPSSTEFIQLFQDPEFVSLFDSFNQTTFQYQPVYHLKLNRPWAQIEPLMQNLFRQTDLYQFITTHHKKIYRFELEMWVDPNSYSLKQILISINLATSLLPNQIGWQNYYLTLPVTSKRTFDIRFGWQFENVNQPQIINPPVIYLPIDKFEQELEQAALKKELLQLADRINQFYATHNQTYPQELNELVEENLLVQPPILLNGKPYKYLIKEERVYLIVELKPQINYLVYDLVNQEFLNLSVVDYLKL